MEELNQQVEQQEKYDGSSIQVLEGLEAVRMLFLGFSRQEHWSGLPFPSPMHESEK